MPKYKVGDVLTTGDKTIEIISIDRAGDYRVEYKNQDGDYERDWWYSDKTDERDDLKLVNSDGGQFIDW